MHAEAVFILMRIFSKVLEVEKNGKRFGVLRAYSYLCRRIAGFATNNNPKKRNIMDDYPAETCKE